MAGRSRSNTSKSKASGASTSRVTSFLDENRDATRMAGGIGIGLALGAGLMYFLDPERGDRRRALVRDKVVHYGHVVEDSVSSTARDLGNRAKGVVADVRGSMSSGSNGSSGSDSSSSRSGSSPKASTASTSQSGGSGSSNSSRSSSSGSSKQSSSSTSKS